MKKAIFAATPLSVALLAAASSAAAQDRTEPGRTTQDQTEPATVAVPPPSGNADAIQLGDVVVTAQRRLQNLQKVPITMNVFSDEAVERGRITDVSEVANKTVGLSFDAFPASQPRPAIRGIGSSDRGAAGDPSTAVFVDEVYMGRPAAVAFDAFDVERIEVLKGPQGTLWGKNVVGGALHVVSNRPSLSGFDASVAATVGDYGRREVAGFVNLPIGQTLAARISVSSRAHDGYVRNLYLGNRVEDERTESLRAQLLFEPNERLTVLFAADGTRNRPTLQARHTIGVDPASATAPLWAPTIDRDPSVTRMEINGDDDRDTYGLRLNVDYDFGGAVLSSVSSYRWLDYDSFGDGDGGNPTINRINIRGGQFEDTTFWSQELRLSAPSGSRLSWVGGLYFYHADTDRTDLLVLDSPPAPSGSFLARDQYDQTNVTDSVAVFADATYPVTERLNVFGGLRYSRDKKDYSVSTAASTALIRATSRYDVAASASWNETTWRIGADYDLAERVMLYGLVSTGFKSGGFQDTPETPTSAVIPFAPENATNYEVGLKTQLFDRALTLNPSVFWIDYQDLQVRRTVGFDTFTSNAGSARIRGTELSAVWTPQGGFSLAASYAYTDARFVDLVTDGLDLSGNRLNRNPRHKLSLSPSYEYVLASGASVFGAVDVNYESFIYDDIDNNDLNVRPARTLVDVRLGYRSADGRWEATLWGKNVTDEITITHQYILAGGQFANYGPPATYGATLRWHY